MDTLLASLDKKKKLLSQLERQVLDFMLNNTEVVKTTTINDLSKRLFVSTATISRTAQKLGFNGYQEFKYVLSNHHENSFIEQHHQNDKPQNNLTNYQEQIIENLNASLSTFNSNAIQQVAFELKKASYVEIFAVGGSYSLGVDLAKKLFHLGINANIRMDWDDLLLASKSLSNEGYAIFISQSGETIQLIEYLNLLNNRNVPNLIVSGNKQSPLVKRGNKTIIVKTTPFYFGDVDLSSRLSMNMIIDLLAIEIAQIK